MIRESQGNESKSIFRLTSNLATCTVYKRTVREVRKQYLQDQCHVCERDKMGELEMKQNIHNTRSMSHAERRVGEGGGMRRKGTTKEESRGKCADKQLRAGS